MDFKYNEKESFTLSEVKEIISQHNGFKDKQYKDYKSADEFSKLEQELKPFKEAARSEKLLALIPDKANKDLSKDILRLTDLNEDMSDEDITKAFETTVSAREYLQAKKTTDPAGLKVEKGNKIPSKPISKEQSDKDMVMSNL